MAWKNDQVSSTETAQLLKLAESSLDLPGDWVEFGCYAGDTSLLLADLLKKSTSDIKTTTMGAPKFVPQKGLPVFLKITRRLWLYDSFAGLPPKSLADQSALGEAFQSGALSVTKRAVKARFLRANLPLPIIKKAWFSDLTPADLPDQVAFAFIDGDFYQSIKNALNLLDGKLSTGSILAIHDYSNPALPGVRRAVDEWLGAGLIQPSFHTFETLAIIKIK